MPFDFSIALSALRASQYAIDTTSHNLANANTEGYHRQRVEFVDRDPRFVPVSNVNQGVHIGTGVEVGSVDRIRDQVLETAYTNSISDLNQVQRLGSIESQIESLLKPGEGSLHQTLGGFFDELSRLSANPSEIVQRNAVIEKSIGIAQQTRSIANGLTDLKSNVKKQIEIEVDELNQQLKTLADLQLQIKNASVGSSRPNDLYDQRDQLINRIAEKIDVQRMEHADGGFGLAFGGYAASQGPTAIAFEAAYDEDGNVGIRLAGTSENLDMASGTLSSLAESYNFTIDHYQDKLNEFASNLIRNINQAHAQGVGTGGAHTVLRSDTLLDSTTLPLDQAGIPFPVEAGDLYLSVTDPTGEKRTYAINIDPATESLTDVANKISAIGDVQAVVDSDTGHVSIIATPGFQFDFTGNQETVPDLTGFTGTSVPRFSGVYEGDTNRQLSVSIVGSGEIGKTPGLTAQVTDQVTGKVIAELDVGDTYEAGSSLAVTEGIELTFSGGTVVGGDSFDTHLVANSDKTGFLSAMGINALFTGTDASDIAVSNRIVEDPYLLATSKTGDIADTSNLSGLLNLRDSNLVGETELTFEDYLSETTSEIGFQVQNSLYLEESLTTLSFQYASDIASVSGVDLNEEMVQLAQYQKQYEAAVQVLRTMENMMDELFTLIR